MGSFLLRAPLAGGAFLAACALASPALADDAGGANGDGKKDASPVKIGAGLIGIMGGSFLDKPSDRDDLYPGFGGFGGGGGLMLDARFIDLLGLEVNVIRSSDRGTGTITFNQVFDLDVTIGQSAWHVPILAKVVVPAGVVAPLFFVGPELVFPSAAEASTSPELAAAQGQVGAAADSYVMITGGFGLEIRPPLPALDLRIPITFRGSFNPGVPGRWRDRIDVPAQNQLVYRSEWKYQAAATLGAAAYF